MNRLVLIFALLFFIVIFAEAARAKTGQVVCQSTEEIESSKLVFTAYSVDARNLLVAKISGPYETGALNLEADRFRSEEPKYEHYYRFQGLEDASCEFQVFMPRKITFHQFVGYVEKVCGKDTESIELDCRLF